VPEWTAEPFHLPGHQLEFEDSFDFCRVLCQTAVSLKGALIAFGIGSDVVFIHNEHLREGDNLRDYIQKYILSRGHNIAVSNALGKALPVETTVIPNPVPRHFDKYQPGYKQHDDSQRYLLFVGRLAKSKGCDIAIRAFARVHSDRDSLRFKICGDGDQRGRLEALSHNLNMDASVEFHGWVNRSRLVPMLTNASAVLVPSRGPEAFGLVALESIACGTPVVASRLGGLPEAVGECGTLVKPDDVDAMVKGIKATLDTSGSRRLAEEMAKHTNRHSIASVADRYIDEFYGLVRKDHNR
jgi:glycosyltransferase involved in cell wall biosynthesis